MKERNRIDFIFYVYKKRDGVLFRQIDRHINKSKGGYHCVSFCSIKGFVTVKKGILLDIMVNNSIIKMD